MLARLGRFVAHHAGVVVLLWAVATVAGFAAALGVVGEGLFARLSAGEPTVASESTDGRAILQSASTSGPAISLLVDGVAPTDPAVTEPVLAAIADLAALVGVQSAASPVLPPGAPIDPEVAAQTAALTAADGNGFLVSVTLQPDLDGPTEDALLDATQARLTALGAEITAAVPSATTMVGGGTLLFDVDHRPGGEGPGHRRAHRPAGQPAGDGAGLRRIPRGRDADPRGDRLDRRCAGRAARLLLS